LKEITMDRKAIGRCLARLVGALVITLYAAHASAQQVATARAFDAGNSPDPWPYTDWSVGEYKAECSSGGPAFGLSAFGEAHSLLCESPYEHRFGDDLQFNTDGAQVFSSSNSAAYGHYGDWDYGYYKGDCPSGDFIVGVAQTPSGALDHVLCGYVPPDPDGLAPDPTDCEAATFPGDTPISLPDGDWAYGYYKLECPDNKVMVSISADPSSHQPHGILCCGLRGIVG
jgi:hypothetical protein